MVPPKAAGSSREQILDAATRVASEQGLLAMTLDNVAKEAGLSKGGLMYHFPTKDILVSSMIEHFGGKVRRALTERVARDPEPSGRWIRAMVALMLPEPGQPRAETDPSHPDLALPSMKALNMSILAAIAVNPDLCRPLRQFGSEVRDLIIGEGDLDQLITWLAVDGLMLWSLFGLMDDKDPLFEQIAGLIRARTRSQSKPSSETDSKDVLS